MQTIAVTPAVAMPRQLFPPLDAETMITSLIAGVAADLTWEFWARVITPFIPGVGGPLEPAALVQSVFGLESRLVGEIDPSRRRLPVLPARLSVHRPPAPAADRPRAALVT